METTNKAKISIYQIDSSKDPDSLRFVDLYHTNMSESTSVIDKSRYQNVYEYLDNFEDPSDLEKIYAKFNIDKPEMYTGTSLSVSDVIVVEKDGKTTSYFCDSFGFKEVDFVSDKDLVWKYEVADEVSNILGSGSDVFSVVYADTEEEAIRLLKQGRNSMKRYAENMKYKQYYDFSSHEWRWM